MLAHLLEKYDLNKDGVLDQDELAALRKDLAEGKIGPPPVGPGPLAQGGPGPLGPGGPRPYPGGPGTNGPGPGPVPKEILDKYDLNRDGILDENERAALRKDMEEGKLQLPPPVPGLPPPGFRPPPTAKEIIEKFDVDKDGKLDETELAAFLKEMRLHRPPPPFLGPLLRPPGGGPPPDGGPFGGPPPEGAQRPQ